MNPELQSQFDEFDKPLIIRRKLLPWWMKTFCWICMLLAVAAIGSLITNLFVPTVNVSIYGFSSNMAFSLTGIFIIAIMVLKGLAAYLLWFEKNHAILIGKIDAICGIVICVASMFIHPITGDDGHFSLRLEILLLIPYYVKLNRIEYEWDNLESI